MLGEAFGVRPSQILSGSLEDLMLDLVLYSKVAKKRQKNLKRQKWS